MSGDWSSDVCSSDLFPSHDNVYRVGVLWLNSKTKTQGKAGDKQGAGYQLIEKEDTTKDYDLFLSTKSLWENLNKNAKPKNITYSLTHKL